MAPIIASEEVLIKISTEAATNFVESFYPALQSARSTIAPFYVKPSAMPGGTTLPTILMNGNTVASGAAVQEIFEKQMPPARYEVQSLDCQIINRCYLPPEAKQSDNKSGKNSTILVLVSGVATFGDPVDEPPKRSFSETFVLVPNYEQADPRNRRTRRKDYLIQSQNFRQVT